jgi:uncharacterized protein YndB with AHSA1/START domain
MTTYSIIVPITFLVMSTHYVAHTSITPINNSLPAVGRPQRAATATKDYTALFIKNDTMKKKDLIVTRVFNAPLPAVWKAWSDAESVMKWWGPTGFTSPVCKMDFREGGTTLVCMRAPKEFGGMDMYNTWTWKKIVPMEFIEYTFDWADKDGNKIDPASLGFLPPGMPREMRHTLVFKDLGNGKTEMVMTEYGYVSDQQYELSKGGLEQCLDKMAAAIETK